MLRLKLNHVSKRGHRWWFCLLLWLAGLISWRHTPSWTFHNLWSSWTWLKAANLVILWRSAAVPQPVPSLTQTWVTQPGVRKHLQWLPWRIQGRLLRLLPCLRQLRSCSRARYGCPHDCHSARTRSPFRTNSPPSRFPVCLSLFKSLDKQFRLSNQGLY